MFGRIKKGLLIVAGIVVTVVGMAPVVNAAPPAIEMTQGIVASSQTATFVPATVGPVSFSASGACPRWSGTIQRTNLAAQPINSDITASSLDAGDTVTFTVTLRNTSVDGAAFDVTLNNDLPDGFELPGTGNEGANLCVTRGDNTTMSYVSNGAGFFGPTETDNIELVDSAGGSLAPTHPTNGTDIAIITFDLVVADEHVPNSTRVSTSNLLFYSDSEGGSLIEGDTESAMVKMGTFGRTKSLIATSQPFTSSNFVVVGEQMTYQLTVQVPHGETDDVSIVDTMMPGLAFLSCESIVNDHPASLSTSLSGGISAACDDPTNPVIASDGRIVTFSLGDLTNTDRDDTEDETITIVYRGIVVNRSEAQNNATLNNSAVVRWEGNNSATSESAPVMIRESKLQLATSTTPNQQLKSGDRVSVSVTVSHDAQSNAPAFDAAISGALPAGLTPDTATLDCTSGSLTPGSCSFSGQTLTAEWSTLGLGQTTVITFEAIIAEGIAGQTLQTPFSVLWSSLQGDVTTPQSVYSALSTERTGDTTDPGTTSNTYAASAVTTAAIAALPTPPSNSDDGAGNDNGAEGAGSQGQLAGTGISTGTIVLLASALVLVALVFGKKRGAYRS